MGEVNILPIELYLKEITKIKTTNKNNRMQSQLPQGLFGWRGLHGCLGNALAVAMLMGVGLSFWYQTVNPTSE